MRSSMLTALSVQLRRHTACSDLWSRAEAHEKAAGMSSQPSCCAHPTPAPHGEHMPVQIRDPQGRCADPKSAIRDPRSQALCRSGNQQGTVRAGAVRDAVRAPASHARQQRVCDADDAVPHAPGHHGVVLPRVLRRAPHRPPLRRCPHPVHLRQGVPRPEPDF